MKFSGKLQHQTLLMFCISCLHGSAAQAALERLPEEVITTRDRPIRMLVLEIQKAEDRMFGLFNAMTDEDQYHILCHWERRPGSRLRQRQCRPAFWDEARAYNAQTYLRFLRGEYGSDLNSVDGTVALNYSILEKMMQEAVSLNPEFLEAIEHHNELREKLREHTRIEFFSDK